MKKFFFLLLLPILGFAQDCKVDGISDSPQVLNCRMKSAGRVQKLHLSCAAGSYRIEWMNEISVVTVAYHEEVETGDNPLVFLTEAFRFTVTGKKAELSSKTGSARGQCR